MNLTNLLRPRMPAMYTLPWAKPGGDVYNVVKCAGKRMTYNNIAAKFSLTQELIGTRSSLKNWLCKL